MRDGRLGPLREHDADTVAARDPQACQRARELVGAGAKLGEGVLAHPPRVVLVHERHAGTVAGVAVAGVDGDVVDGRDGPAEAGVDVGVRLAAGQERVRHGPVAYHLFEARLGRRGPSPATAGSARSRA